MQVKKLIDLVSSTRNFKRVQSNVEFQKLFKKNYYVEVSNTLINKLLLVAEIEMNMAVTFREIPGFDAWGFCINSVRHRGRTSIWRDKKYAKINALITLLNRIL